VIRVHANFERMNALVAYLTENCCGGVACEPACAAGIATERKRKSA